MNFLVKARADSPVAFRAGRDARREETLGFVPGSALLGGFASTHILARPQKKDEFADFFLKEKIIFGNLYPSNCSKSNRLANPIDQSNSPVRPLPRTARSCKRFGGFSFHAQADDDARHGVWDSLIAWSQFALSSKQNISLLEQLQYCRNCKEPIDTFSGFYRQGTISGQWGTPDVGKGLFTRTGVSRERGAAAEGVIYSREFLRDGSEFQGEWAIDNSIAQDLEDYLDEVSGGLLRVGHNRTRGLGKLVLPDLQQFTPDIATVIERRAKDFDAKLKQDVGAEARHVFYLPLTLTSDCILPDGFGRYSLQISPEILAKEWGINGAELIYCNAASRRVIGWNVLWGLPKADELAIAMGSVFLVALSAEPDWQVLASNQSKGLGIRRAEGFGTIRIADEFHLEASGV